MTTPSRIASRLSPRIGPLRRWWRDTGRQIFGVDLRSLAVFRMVLAIIVLIDLAGRARFLGVHYTDSGLVPRDLLLASGRLNEWRWSVNLLGGTALSQGVLFTITALAAVGLLVGYRTRLMTVVLWVMVVSIQARNPLLLNSADGLLRALMFWSMFLPLGAWWAIDSRRAVFTRRPAPLFTSWATAGLIFQIAFMYWFTAALKTDRSWREDGTALYYSLGGAQFTTPFGEWVHQFGDVLKGLTFATMGIEIIAPILLFTPFLIGPVRTAGVLAIMLLQGGIFLTLYIGFFPLLSAGCMVCCLPGWFWDSALPRTRDLSGRAFREIGQRLTPPAMGVAPEPGASAAGRSLDLSWGGLSFNVAVTSAPAQSPAKPADDTPQPAGTSDAQPGRQVSRPLTNIVAAILLIFIFAANMETVSAFRIPQQARPVGHALGLFQQWSMFAPAPLKSTDWYVVRGTLADGTEADLLYPLVHDDFDTIRIVSWSQPDFIGKTLYRGEHWRKYLNSITFGRRAERREFAGYLCRTWNDRYAGALHLDSIDVVQMRRRTLPDYQRAEVVPTPRFQFECAGGRSSANGGS